MEDYSLCPFALAELYRCTGWFATTSGTSDYLNTCAVNLAPSNIWGYRWPRTGSGYCGFYAYASNIDTNVREYISGQLTEPMIAGQLYCFSYYVSLSDSSNVSVSNLGIYFSSNNPTILTDSLGNPFFENLPYSPQYQESSFVSQSNSWHLITDSYIATGGETYFTIGNFRSDQNSVLDTFAGPLTWLAPYICYIYIDDVSVEACSSPPYKGSLVNIPNVFTPNGDGLNDFFVVDSKKLKQVDLKIYNRWGNRVFSTDSMIVNWDGNDQSGNACAEGCYYYVFNASGEDDKVYSMRGFFMLIR